MEDGLRMAGLLLGSAALNVAGVTLLKLASASGTAIPAVLGSLCWGGSAAVFLELLKLDRPIAVLGPLTSAAGFLALIAIGAAFWGEHLNRHQVGSLCLLVLSMALFSLSSGK